MHRVPQSPNVARLGPGPSLVAVTVAAAAAAGAAEVTNMGERKDLGRAVTHGRRAACLSSSGSHPHELCINI